MQTIEASATAMHLEELTLVSMNVAGCVPSRSARRGWTKQDSVRAMRDEVLRTDPDIVALQECPGRMEWASATFPAYVALGAVRSHADYVILLVRKGIEAEILPIVDTELDHVPAVLVKLKTGDRELLVASMHLAPFREGSFERRMQFQAVIRQSAFSAGDDSIPLIMAGDTNMRVAEDRIMEDELKLQE